MNASLCFVYRTPDSSGRWWPVIATDRPEVDPDEVADDAAAGSDDASGYQEELKDLENRAASHDDADKRVEGLVVLVNVSSRDLCFGWHVYSRYNWHSVT